MIPDATGDETTPTARHDGASHRILPNMPDSLLPLHLRLFLALLARVDYTDLERIQFTIPITELLPHQRAAIVEGSSTDLALKQMSQNVLSIRLHIEEPERDAFGSWNLISTVTYDGERGTVRVTFTEEAMPYLLLLHHGGNYLSADLHELCQLRPVAAQYLYGLLQEHGNFLHPSVDRDQLQLLLGRPQGEPHKRTLGQPEGLPQGLEQLKATTLPFAYEVYQDRQLVKHINVVFPNKTDKSFVFSRKK